ncbi:MAG TPA: type 1 glutamine amidotransferase [Actinomycetota bacterium]|nr:type 1 glutamine amidotransferase [Actinomycetota bacterium]
MTDAEGRLRALILQKEDPTPPGHVTEWLAERGIDEEVHRIDLEDDRGLAPRDYDLIVSLGSEFAAFDDTKEFVRREARLIERAAEADVPVLGLCFGGQLLARVLGGQGFRATSEIGWLPVRSRDPDLVPEGPWFQWHFDSFTVPEDATLIAESDAGPQAFIAGRSLGLQFHPEVTVDIMDEWVRTYRHELDAEGVDPDGLLEETKRRAIDSKRMAWRLFDGFLEGVARVGSAGGSDRDAGARAGH